METVLITGGTGLIGTRLTELLVEKGYRVIILTRSIPVIDKADRVRYAKWDLVSREIDPDAIKEADYVIHLAGAGVAEKRWSEKRKQEIVSSRTKTGALLSETIGKYPNKIKAVISMSAIGWYGPDTDRSKAKGFEENALPDRSFLGETCREWEAAVSPITDLGKRLVIFRTGIVLSDDGGAFTEFRKPLRARLATILANGKQAISWIHIDDLCRMFILALENRELNGVYNAVAPNPVTNRQLVMQLAKKICGRFFLPVYVPAFVLKIMLGEMSIEVLKSATVSARKILQTGFVFSYPEIESAIDDLV
jgi:uncharacterized protein (TIGR01777 family)